jgi:hypothetical protein
MAANNASRGEARRLMRLAIYVALAMVGCVTARPLPAQQQADYFTCPGGVSIADAEGNIAAAGLLIASKGDSHVQTDWGRVDLEGQEVAAEMIAGMHSPQARIAATMEGDRIRFRVFQRVQQGTRTHEGELTITDQMVADQVSVRVLNQHRRAVCGGSDFFPPPAVKRRRGSR